MDILFVFLIGASVGSFINLCICRIPKGENIVIISSHCMSCGAKIRFLDMIPLLGYLRLRGMCRTCKSRISLRYPVFEFLTGIIWTGLFANYGNSVEFLKYAFLVSVLIIAAMIDYDTGEVYSCVTITGMAAGILMALLAHCCFKEIILGGLIGFLPVALMALCGGMGWGDAEVCLMSGLFLGPVGTFNMLKISFILGGIAAIVLMTAFKADLKRKMPFVPCIAASTILTLILPYI